MDRRRALLETALRRLESREDILSVEASWRLLRHAGEASGAFDGMGPCPWMSDQELVGRVLRLGEVEMIDLTVSGQDSLGVFLAGICGSTDSLDKVEQFKYLGFIEAYDHTGSHPDPRSRLRTVLLKVLLGKPLELANPFILPVMDRFRTASTAISRAYVAGALRPGRYTTCAAHHILTDSETGETPDARWVNAFEHEAYGRPLPDDCPRLSYFAARSGYTPEEIVAIETAFEAEGLRGPNALGGLLAVMETLERLEIEA